MRVGGADFMHDPLFDLHLLCKHHDIIYKMMDFLAFVCSRLGKKTGSYDKVDHQSLGCNDLAFHNTSRF